MDIDAMERQVSDLTAWKKAVEPTLASLLPGYEEHMRERAERAAEGAVQRTDLRPAAASARSQLRMSEGDTARMESEQRTREQRRIDQQRAAAEQAGHGMPVTMPNPAPSEPGVEAAIRSAT